MWAAATFAIAILRSLIALFRSRQNQAIVELALRHQLAIYAYRHPKPRLSRLDRALWVALSRFWPRWKNALVVVQPETVIRWHREGFRRYWRSISVPGPGRPPISEDTRKLIVRMATENHWRARKIQAELSKLGIELSLMTISRYLPKAQPDPGSHQRWITFLRNHRDVIAGMDFFVVPTVRFQLLYVWFAIDHGRRRILHFNVTANPAARWVIQQLRNAFPDEAFHRFLIFDNDSIFSEDVAGSIAGFGIQPRRTAFRSPWQNGTAERSRSAARSANLLARAGSVRPRAGDQRPLTGVDQGRGRCPCAVCHLTHRCSAPAPAGTCSPYYAHWASSSNIAKCLSRGGPPRWIARAYTWTYGGEP